MKVKRRKVKLVDFHLAPCWITLRKDKMINTLLSKYCRFDSLKQCPKVTLNNTVLYNVFIDLDLTVRKPFSSSRYRVGHFTIPDRTGSLQVSHNKDACHHRFESDLTLYERYLSFNCQFDISHVRRRIRYK